MFSPLLLLTLVCSTYHFANLCAALSYIFCTALNPTSLYCSALYCTILHSYALHCMSMYCNSVHCTTLYYFAQPTLHYTVLNCSTLYYTALHLNVYVNTGRDSKAGWTEGVLD